MRDLLQRLLRRAERRLPALTRYRRPENLPIELHRRRIYIVPTGFGLGFSVLLLVMLVMYLALGWRRDARAARGLCAGCGYDLRGLKEPTARCPECGMALAATATR